MEKREKLLEIENLCKWFPMKYGIADAVSGRKRRFLKAVDNISLTIFAGGKHRAGRRIRLRQIHPGQDHPAALQTDERAADPARR